MADDTMLFTVDASDIIVKLHFSGLQAVRRDASQGNGFVVNTGIVDDDPQGSPEKLGKTKFDLKNQTGEYYAGIVTDFTYFTSFKLQNAITDVFKLRAKLYGNGKKLLDPAGDEEDIKKFDEYANMIKDAFKKAGAKVPDDESFHSEEGLIKVRDDASKIVNSDVSDDYDRQLSAKTVEVAKVIDKYMNVFAGADNTKDINKSNVIAMQVSNDFKSVKDCSKFIKDFKIQPISSKEQETIDAKLRQDSANSKDASGKVECTARMCFYVKYVLKVEQQ